jgi:hypothetical protein
MEIQHQGRRVRTQRIAVVLAAMLALALPRRSAAWW